MENQDWDNLGKGCQQLGCAITLFVFIVVPLLFLGCGLMGEAVK